MSILFVLVPLSLALVVFAGWAFFWAVGAGQFDDLDSPGWEILRDEEPHDDREKRIADGG
ncbi:MAG TPA: cbb3-type cytochrome oxidase assembly protein CcoS [Steroidobacter sp.]|nr:cbb3-type cytochrome oxidase assembly protein CcoS [Steroidobacter sp.]